MIQINTKYGTTLSIIASSELPSPILMVWLSAGAQLGVVTCFTAAPGNFSPGAEAEYFISGHISGDERDTFNNRIV